MDYSTMKPGEVRSLIREGKIISFTSGMCNGYAQANLVVLPKDLAFDFLLFTTRNPKPCPVLDVTEVGSPEPRAVAPGADLRYDIPKYRIYRHGELADEVTDLSRDWRVSFWAAVFPLKVPCWMRDWMYGILQRITMCPCTLPTFPAHRRGCSMGPWWYPCAP